MIRGSAARWIRARRKPWMQWVWHWLRLPCPMVDCDARGLTHDQIMTKLRNEA